MRQIVSRGYVRIFPLGRNLQILEIIRSSGYLSLSILCFFLCATENTVTHKNSAGYTKLNFVLPKCVTKVFGISGMLVSLFLDI